jgi:hypothetical protein
MITLLGAIVLATVVVIGPRDWASGLAPFQRPASVDDRTEPARDGPEHSGFSDPSRER